MIYFVLYLKLFGTYSVKMFTIWFVSESKSEFAKNLKETINLNIISFDGYG